jgi:hypothetical protein
MLYLAFSIQLMLLFKQPVSQQAKDRDLFQGCCRSLTCPRCMQNGSWLIVHAHYTSIMSHRFVISKVGTLPPPPMRIVPRSIRQAIDQQSSQGRLGDVPLGVLVRVAVDARVDGRRPDGGRRDPFRPSSRQVPAARGRPRRHRPRRPPRRPAPRCPRCCCGGCGRRASATNVRGSGRHRGGRCDAESAAPERGTMTRPFDGGSASSSLSGSESESARAGAGGCRSGCGAQTWTWSAP